MFSNLLDLPQNIMTLGAKAHARLNSTMIPEIQKMMEEENWTCHICMIRIPEMMEVDHLEGHSPKGKKAIKPICQFCHNLKHPIWAASRHRLSLIHAPDLTYPEISCLAWAMSIHAGQEGFQIDTGKIAMDLELRRKDAFEALGHIGHANIESIIEAILTVKDGRGKKKTREILEEIDQYIRFVPTILLDSEARIKTWTDGGFRQIQDEWKEIVVKEKQTPYESLWKAGELLQSKLN